MNERFLELNFEVLIETTKNPYAVTADIKQVKMEPIAFLAEII